MRSTILYIIAAFAIAVPASATTQTFLGDSSGTNGESISVPLQFLTDDEILGVQFDVSVEAGSGAVSGVRPGLDFRFTDHVMEVENLPSGLIRVLIYSRSSEGLYSGRLARIIVELAANVPANARSIALSKVVFATRHGSKAALEVVPHLVVTNPMPGLHSAPGSAIQLEAESADTPVEGTVVQVGFFANGESIGTDDAAPFGTVWSPAAAGNYAITAQATSTTGEVRVSEPVPVHIGVSSGFEGWRLANFDAIQLADSTVSGTGANPDGDRLNNAGEFGFGGQPLSVDHAPVAAGILTDHVTGDRYLSLTFWRSIFVSGAHLTIEHSGNLSDWLPAPGSVVELVAVPQGDLERVTIFDSRPIGVGEPFRMLRASVQLP